MLENLFLQGHVSALWIINSSVVEEGRINTQAVGPVSSTGFSQAGVQWKLQPGLWDSSRCRRGNPAELGWDGAARPQCWHCSLGVLAGHRPGHGTADPGRKCWAEPGSCCTNPWNLFWLCPFRLKGKQRRTRPTKGVGKGSLVSLSRLVFSAAHPCPAPWWEGKKTSPLKPCTYCGVH